MKLATIDFRRLGPKLGRLAETDARAVSRSLGAMTGLAPEQRATGD